MKVVVAYSGSPAASAAVSTLAAQGADVVTVTLDIGQTEPLDEIRARALRSGAVRAHVIDARDAFARTCVLPAMQGPGGSGVEAMARQLIVKALADVAAIEGSDAVAHAPAPPAPAGADRRERHLLIRPSVDPEQAPDSAARLDITLEDGVPTAVNDVPMALTELIESLSLIGGQHGIGHTDTPGAPAAVILRAAYASAPDSTGTVHLTLHRGTIAVSPPAGQDAELVTRS